MDKCPFCGADGKSARGYYRCSTHEKQGELGMWYLQSSECKDNQIAKLQERLEAWRKWHRNAQVIGSLYEDDLELKRLEEI